MAELVNNSNVNCLSRPSLIEKALSLKQGISTRDDLQLTYFDLLDETPEFSEAAILLKDGTVEFSYVKTGEDGNQYFGFNRCMPWMVEYGEIIARHKLTREMGANTFERYPSGKTVLSKRGKILEINLPQLGHVYV